MFKLLNTQGSDLWDLNEEDTLFTALLSAPGTHQVKIVYIIWLPKKSHCKQTTYAIWRGMSRYRPLPDISTRWNSKVQGTDQETHSRRYTNGFQQRACGGSADWKVKQCQKRGRNNEDRSHTVIIHLWWIWEILRCSRCLQEAYGKHINIRHAISYA